MKKFMLMCVCLISSQIMANDKAIIVLDASGSMWGQLCMVLAMLIVMIAKVQKLKRLNKKEAMKSGG